jgi:hypothetical protein
MGVPQGNTPMFLKLDSRHQLFSAARKIGLRPKMDWIQHQLTIRNEIVPALRISIPQHDFSLIIGNQGNKVWVFDADYFVPRTANKKQTLAQSLEYTLESLGYI